MIKFILTLAVIGGLIGLIFSNRGGESDGLLRGAKKGAKLGCFLYLLLAAAIILLILLFAAGA